MPRFVFLVALIAFGFAPESKADSTAATVATEVAEGVIVMVGRNIILSRDDRRAECRAAGGKWTNEGRVDLCKMGPIAYMAATGRISVASILGDRQHPVAAALKRELTGWLGKPSHAVNGGRVWTQRDDDGTAFVWKLAHEDGERWVLYFYSPKK